MELESAILTIALAFALWMRPWRLLVGGHLLSPMLAVLVLLPWLWALPALHRIPLQLHWSGASLVLLLLGWPLAMPVLTAVGLIAYALSPMAAEQALGITVWQGVVPATLALMLGAAIRRWIGTHLFIYILGRGFLGTVLCLFLGGLLAQWAGHTLPDVPDGLSLVARWLTAWGDAFVTGMLCAIFVAFKPHWLATWSDQVYLARR